MNHFLHEVGVLRFYTTVLLIVMQVGTLVTLINSSDQQEKMNIIHLDFLVVSLFIPLIGSVYGWW